MELNPGSTTNAADQAIGTHLTGSNGRLLNIVFDLLKADPATANPGEQHSVAESEAARRPWVLCIDDDVDFAQALNLRLAALGIGLIRAADGMEGFRYAVTRPADVILLDYQLPNGRGDYVLSRLKGNPATADIPVIVVTGERDRALQRKLSNIGAERFLNKPVNMSELLIELRRHIYFPLPL